MKYQANADNSGIRPPSFNIYCEENIMKYLPLFLLPLFLLAGCLGEPSDKDLYVAVEKSLNQDTAVLSEAGKALGDAGKTLTDLLVKKELHAVKKIGCVSAQNAPGYVCDVELDLTVPVMGRTKETISARFVNGPDGWVMVK